MTITIPSLQKFAHRFVGTIPFTPTGRYASIILLRETKSYAIFTTEGGEQQDVEQTQAGLHSSERVDRLVMFKRKQVAPERRTGKALARQYVFPYVRCGKVENKKMAQVLSVATGEESVIQAINEQKPSKVNVHPNGTEHSEAIAEAVGKVGKGKKDIEGQVIYDCYLTEGLCTHCPDCLTYGYAAVEGEGARKSRIMTDSCFSVRPYQLIQKRINFNVINEKDHTSGTITKYDYTIPSVFLPSVITTIDLTANEFTYILGNVLRTARYGKESTRQGTIRNHVLAIAFSDVELFANLEFTQGLYDAFTADESIDLSAGYLSLQEFEKHAPKTIQVLTADAVGRLEFVQGDDLSTLLKDVRQLNQDEQALATFLRDLTTESASFIV